MIESVLLLSFVLWGVFSFLGNPSRVFHKHNIYEKPWHVLKLGYTLSTVKRRMLEAEDSTVKSSLQKCMFYLKVSRIFLMIFFLTFIYLLLT